MPAYKQLYLDMKNENEELKNALENAKLMIQIKRDLVDDKQDEICSLKEEMETLQEHYDHSIHTDWIAEASGEDPEYFRDVCCAQTLGNMIKENKQLKNAIKHNVDEIHDLKYEKKELTEKIDDLENTILHLESENEQLTESAVKYEIAFDKLKRSQSK